MYVTSFVYLYLQRLESYPFDFRSLQQSINKCVLSGCRSLFLTAFKTCIKSSFKPRFLRGFVSFARIYLTKRRIGCFFYISHYLSRRKSKYDQICLFERCYLFDCHSFLTSVDSYIKSQSCVTTFNVSILK